MDADSDLRYLDEIPDVIPAGGPAERPPPAPRIVSAGPARDVVRRRRALALLGGLAWFAAQVATLGLRDDLPQLGALFMLVHVALPAALGAAALGVALWPGRDGLGARAGTLRAVTIAALAALLAATLIVPAPFQFTAPQGSDPTVTWMLVCADIVLVMGAIPLALAAAAWRSAFPVSAAEHTAAIGAACGLGAVASMHLHCENILTYHVVAGHLVPGAALASLGALVLHRFTRA